MADSEEMAAILKRALTYPYATPSRSYLYLEGAAEELPDGGPDLVGRTPVLSYGANAAPEALARKLASLPGVPMPVLRAELEHFDVVYSAHVSPYGAVPATLVESPGTRAPVFVVYPTAEQLALLTAQELNYDFVSIDGVSCQLENSSAVTKFAGYRSKHGPLVIDGNAVALAAIPSHGRTLPELDQPAVLERVRTHTEPELTLEEFIHTCVKHGGMRLSPPLRPE